MKRQVGMHSRSRVRRVNEAKRKGKYNEIISYFGPSVLALDWMRSWDFD